MLQLCGEQRPEDLEASRLVQEYEETRSFAWRNQPWRNRHHPNSSSAQRSQNSSRGPSEQGNRRTSGQGEQYDGGSSNSSSGNNSSHGRNTRYSNTQDNTGGRSGGSRSNSERQDQGGRRPVTCFGCGEQGHIKPNCPNRVRRVRSPGHSSVMVVDGSYAGQPAKNLQIDTGAEKTVVRQDFVPEVAYTGRTCMLDTWRGSQPSRHRLARITVKVGSLEVNQEVAVAESLDCPALLGANLGEEVTIALMQHIIS